MDRRPYLRNRELSELSPLTQSIPSTSHAGATPGASGLTRNHSYGSILPYLGFLRNSLRRSASSSNQLHACSTLAYFKHSRSSDNHHRQSIIMG
uniref:Uncharacterized protein n=1 Tax=Anopheles epiroticus TaxID=199890 RepID=A0A182P1J6_9DIPT